MQKARFVQRFALFQIFYKGEIIPHEGEVAFNSQWLDQDEVRAFYEKHPQILDSLINSPVPPQPNPTESSDSDSSNYLYLVGAFLLVVGVVYVASKYFSEDTEKASLPLN